MASSVSIMMGSPRDWPVMAGTVDLLDRFGITCEVFVSSAHKTPERTRRYVQGLAARGVSVAVCGAGAAAHLAGVVAASFSGPVIAVPIAATELAGADALLAMVQMPSGVPVATVAIDAAGARNAAVLAAQMIACHDPAVRGRLQAYRAELGEEYGRPISSPFPGVGGRISAAPTGGQASTAPLVAVLYGSPTDAAIMERAGDTLTELDLPHETFVTSPARTPERTRTYACALAERGVRVAICGSGGSAFLGGTVAAHFPGPVVAVPLPTTSLAGMDALLATVQMPAGVPVAAVAIGSMGARNAGLLAGQILAMGDPAIAARLATCRREVGRTLVREADALLATLPERHRGPSAGAEATGGG